MSQDQRRLVAISRQTRASSSKAEAPSLKASRDMTRAFTAMTKTTPVSPRAVFRQGTR